MEANMHESEFISLRSDGQFIWTSTTGWQWTALELFQAALKQDLSPQDEAVVFAVVDQLNRLSRERSKLHPFL